MYVGYEFPFEWADKDMALLMFLLIVYFLFECVGPARRCTYFKVRLVM